jgi:hypothetical protein
MKRKTLWIVSVLLVALLAGVAPGGAIADDDKSGTIVRLIPEAPTVPLGGIVAVQVWVQNTSSFYGAQFELRYNPAILDGVDVVEGPAFPSPAMVTQKTFVGGPARAVFAASRVNPQAPLSGNVHVATIRFRGRSTGTSPLTWPLLLLANDVGASMPYISRNGDITVADLINITGYAHLQGRINHSNIQVDVSGPTPPGATSVTTAPDGRYTVPNARAGTYQMLFEFPTYLATRLTNCVTGGGTSFSPPTVTLLAGDLIRDQRIDILDLTKCAGAFGTADPTADVNGDGIVNIFDLVLIGTNFGQTGPIIIAC